MSLTICPSLNFDRLGHRKCVCAFGNPLEIDNHIKTEAGAILGLFIEISG